MSKIAHATVFYAPQETRFQKRAKKHIVGILAHAL